MNVTCTGCPAKYAVPDEKVRGKKVRITCKHCGTNIVVDGSGLGTEASAAPKAVEPVKAQPAPAAEASYLVGFADDRRETRTVSEIVQLYRSAKIDDDALVWKDGMSDWLAPFDVPEIALALAKAGVVQRGDAFPPSNSGDDEPTIVGRSPFEDSAENKSASFNPQAQPAETKPLALRAPAATAKATATPLVATPKPVAQEVAKPAAAARRAESRSGAVDLFGGVSSAGSESDSSLDIGFPAEEPEHKLTGARNESSVLFSLDALTKPDAKAAGQKKARDKEQEKADSAALFGSSAPDSLMNMGGGGFLAAPDFTKPVTAVTEPQVRSSDPVEVPNTAPQMKKGAAVWIAVVLGIAAAGGGAFFVMQKKGMLLGTAPESAAAETKALPATQASAAGPSPAPAASTASAPSEAAAASANAEASATPSPAEAAAQAITAAGAKPAATPATPTSPSPASAAAVNKPAETKKPDTAAAAAPAPAPAADGAAFDKGAAVSALTAAAANAASCKTPDGPTGSGKVSVTFAPSGRATMTNVGGAFAGTEVGGCVARLFRAAKVPAFDGDPVTVSKSFSIE